MDSGEKLALFIGMLSGDGCLSIKHNGEGYRDYPIDFCNVDKELVVLFNNLFEDLFKIDGRIYLRQRPNRKVIWTFRKYSRKIADKLKALGFPEGVKRDVLRVLPIIKNGTKREQLLFFQGLLITDGCNKPQRGIMFHLGSKLFLEDLANLMSNFIDTTKPVKEFIQKEKYKSYQLYLNKKEKDILLAQMPLWHNGTASVLNVE